MRTFGFWGFIALLVAQVGLGGPRDRGTAHGLDPQLRFTATPVSASFKQGEEVSYDFSIENRGRSSLLVSPLLILNYDIHLKVNDTWGREVAWCGIIAKYVFLKGQFTTLDPGKTIRARREISCDRRHESGFSIVAVGDYSVTATYRFPVPKEMRDHPGPIPLASGSHVSEQSHFAIVRR
jgi:hypothetical protein